MMKLIYQDRHGEYVIENIFGYTRNRDGNNFLVTLEYVDEDEMVCEISWGTEVTVVDKDFEVVFNDHVIGVPTRPPFDYYYDIMKDI